MAAERSSSDASVAPDECNGRPPEEKPTKRPRVIVIGAGISGIAAADVLCRAGYGDIVILEATDRIGGRIWSIEIGMLLFERCFYILYLRIYSALSYRRLGKCIDPTNTRELQRCN